MDVKPVEHVGVWMIPEVHDPKTGRIDAKKLAKMLSVKQAALARAQKVDRRLLGSKPTLPKLQKRVAMLERTLATLIDHLGSVEAARVWFQTPNRSPRGARPGRCARTSRSTLRASRW